MATKILTFEQAMQDEFLLYLMSVMYRRALTRWRPTCLICGAEFSMENPPDFFADTGDWMEGVCGLCGECDEVELLARVKRALGENVAYTAGNC